MDLQRSIQAAAHASSFGMALTASHGSGQTDLTLRSICMRPTAKTQAHDLLQEFLC